MKELKYIWLFDSEGILTHINDAEKNRIYYQYVGDEVEYIVRHGDINRKHFSAKNPFNELSMVNFSGGGESIDHYNAKMEIVFNKKYFDTIIGKEITFHRVLAERKINNKIPDISCYDADNNLVMVIEIYNTNKKNDLDIQALKKLNVPVVEIDINDGNKCEHLILPTLLEANRQIYNEVERIKSDFKDRIRRSEVIIQKFRDKSRKELEELGEKYRSGYSKISSEHSFIEEQIEKEKSDRISKIENYLRYRIKRNIGDKTFITEIQSLEDEVERSRIEFEKTNDKTFKSKYRIDKIKSGIESTKKENNRLELEIRNRRSDSIKNAERCNIEWFRPKFMKGYTTNKIEDIIYFCS